MSIQSKKILSSPEMVQECPVVKTAEIIGRPWKLIILWQLMGGMKRFNELQRLLPGITQKMLTKELRDLEQDGLLQRKVYPQIPPKVEYSLTEEGESLRPVLESMAAWGTSRVQKEKRP